MAWTDQMVADLKRMWDEGLTTGEIGKRLGVSKNSIVGKVHRLKLVSRPSPIKKKGEDTKEKAPVKDVKEAPKTEEKKAAPKIEKEEKPQAKKTEEPKARENFIRTEPISCAPLKKKTGNITLTDLDGHTCRWPIGDPKDEGFHFCGKKVKIGNTYCDEHSAIAYVKTTKK